MRFLVPSGLAASFYMPESIKEEIYQRNEDVFLQPDLRQFPGSDHLHLLRRLLRLSRDLGNKLQG